MRSIKYIVLSTFLAISVFCAVCYTSCTKDACKAVTCINGGNCGGGNCICPKAVGGLNCEIIYRKLYDNVYKGTGFDDSGNVYPNSVLSFSPRGSDTTYSQMRLMWSTGANAISFELVLNTNSSNGSSFTTNASVNHDTTSVGSGIVNSISASMTITQTMTISGVPTVINTIRLDNFVRQ